MNEILDIFYNELINEASKGLVDAFFTYALRFNTKLNGKYIAYGPSDYLVPTIEINDKELFDKLLSEYVRIAHAFYLEEYTSGVRREDDPEFDKNYIKTIITSLFSNASIEDYHDPIKFLEKRIDFFRHNDLPGVEKGSSIGTIRVEVVKDKISHETPYALEIKIDDNEMPQVEFGIYEDTAYIYAIQNFARSNRDKKLNRNMYKVNEGIDLKLESDDNINNPENLKGITPSTLISACIGVSYIKSLGISKLVIPTYLITRWNAKEILNDRRNKDQRKHQEQLNSNEELQRNITDKFIRTFRRLEYHFSNIDIVAYPFVEDTNLVININDNMECNNPLLKEIYEVIEESNTINR